MKPLVTTNIENLRPYQPGKPLEETRRELGLSNAIKMASNENPLGPSPKAVEAMKAVCHEMHYYPDGGCFTLKKHLAGHLNSFDVEPHNIIIGNGSNEIIEFIIRTFVAPDENIITGEHSFIIYKLAGISHNREEIMVPLKENMSYDLDAIAKAVNDKTKVIFLANPNNPSGMTFTTYQLERFFAHIPDDIILCLDEAYHEYVDDPETPNGLEYARFRHRLIVLRTFSKIYGLAGLRIGYGITHKELISYIDRVRPPFNVNRMAQEAAVAALEDQVHIQKSIRLNAEGRKFLQTEFDRMGLKYYPSQTNFILINFMKPADLIYQALLKKGFITRPVNNYELPDCLRVTVGTEAQNRAFIETLEKLL